VHSTLSNHKVVLTFMHYILRLNDLHFFNPLQRPARSGNSYCHPTADVSHNLRYSYF